jgi:hypothetical protein
LKTVLRWQLYATVSGSAEDFLAITGAGQMAARAVDRPAATVSYDDK